MSAPTMDKPTAPQPDSALEEHIPALGERDEPAQPDQVNVDEQAQKREDFEPMPGIMRIGKNRVDIWEDPERAHYDDSRMRLFQKEVECLRARQGISNE
ncbi:unnamed protein product [Caenorhabditis sp. 36 PRJEB53466]|nr:unnamed protein product [Caenorhabditis sp. 36 PRJEB53466]